VAIRQIINKIISNPRSLFLIDGLGALVSAFSLGVFLVQFKYAFGMPEKVLYILAVIACVFAINSLSCYFRNIKNWRPYLKAIAIANLLYCCATLFLVFFHYTDLTVLGIAYFLVEIIIIVVLATFELTTANNK